MKKKLLSLCLLFAVTAVDAQKKCKHDDADIAEYKLNDGKSIRGYNLGWRTVSNNVGPVHLGTRITHMVYADTLSCKEHKIPIAEVKQVIRYDAEGDVYGIKDKISYRTIEDNGQPSSKTSTILENLIYDGKIKIYGSNVSFCEGSICWYSHSTFYLKNNVDTEAVLAVRPKGQFTKQWGSSIENMVDAFRVAGGKCKAFNDYLDYFDKEIMQKQQLNEKLQKEEFPELYKSALQHYKDRKKNGYEGSLNDLISTRIQERQLEIYVGIAREYEKNCPH